LDSFWCGYLNRHSKITKLGYEEWVIDTALGLKSNGFAFKVQQVLEREPSNKRGRRRGR